MSTSPANEPSCVDPADARAIDLVIEGRPRDVGTITVTRSDRGGDCDVVDAYR